MDISILQRDLDNLIEFNCKINNCSDLYGAMVICDFCPFCCGISCTASSFERKKYNLCASAHLNRLSELKKDGSTNTVI